MSTWTEELIGERPAAVTEIAITGDGRHVCWFETVGDGVRFTRDFTPGEAFDTIEVAPGDNFFYSPRRDRIAFWGVRGDDCFVVADGIEHGPYDAYSRNVPPTFSTDGRRLAFGVSPQGAFASTGRLPVHIAIDDALDTESELAPVAPLFSPSGDRVAYVAESGVARRSRWVVLDGHRGPDWGAANLLSFSPDGGRLAYAALRDEQWFGVVDHTSGPACENLAGFVFSPDGSRHAYVISADERMSVVTDGYPEGWHEVVGPPVLSRTNRVAYMAVDDRRSRMVVDGETGPAFDLISLLLDDRGPFDRPAPYGFSPDGRHFAYVGSTTHRQGGLLRRARDEWSLVLDGVSQPLDVSDVTSGVLFSPDGSHVALTAALGREHFVIVDGDPGSAHDGVLFPRWSPDGRLGYAARLPRGRIQIVVGGAGGPVCDRVSTWTKGQDAEEGSQAVRAFEFSRDGRHVAHVGTIGGTERPILDDDVGPAFDFVAFPVFAERAVSWIAARGTAMLRVSRDVT